LQRRQPWYALRYDRNPTERQPNSDRAPGIAIQGVCHTFGTLADGGGAFESVYLQRTHFDGDRFVAVETFELEELERLRAEAAKGKTNVAANAS
jgi:hypothetical protein